MLTITLLASSFDSYTPAHRCVTKYNKIRCMPSYLAIALQGSTYIDNQLLVDVLVGLRTFRPGPGNFPLVGARLSAGHSVRKDDINLAPTT